MSEEELKCSFAPEGMTCEKCPFGPTNAPMGQYANGCGIYEFYQAAAMELREYD